MTNNEPRPASIEYWASKKHNELAIAESTHQVTWSEWNEASDRLAEALASRGLQEGDILAASCKTRIEWAVINGALAKLGCSLLGVNWRLTPSELNYVLENSGAAAFFCDAKEPENLLPALEPLALKILATIDSPAKGFVNWDELMQAEAVPRYSANNVALVVYTSGTTGLPKGVLSPAPKTPEEQKRFMEYVESLAACIPRTPDDVTLVNLPISHGAGPSLVASSIVAGNAMVFQCQYDPEEALRLIEKYKVSIWTGVPTMLKRMAALPDDVIAKYDTSSLRTITTGAAPVPGSLKNWVRETFGSHVLNEAYGATEVGMVAHLNAEMQEIRPASSGYPHKHVEINVKDDQGNPLPAGEAGELWIRTPVTIHNYLNAPALDESTLDKEGFFRVGDVGYLDEDGYLYITDRIKDMIISGGVNLYPAEIEAAIMPHPAVQDVAVIGIPDEEFGEQVKAFIELKPGKTETVEALATFLENKLASYKRPKSIQLVEELPRNAMGKILKREIREPYWQGRERNV